MTDLKITEVIHIGGVPVNAKVKISIKFDFKNSNYKRHLIQYQLCHSESVATGRIGEELKFQFLLPDAEPPSNSSIKFEKFDNVKSESDLSQRPQ